MKKVFENIKEKDITNMFPGKEEGTFVEESIIEEYENGHLEDWINYYNNTYASGGVYL